MRSLGLHIPNLSPPPPHSLLLDPKETEYWFRNLPMANIGETARRVFGTLVEFNRHEAPGVVRAKSVEYFRQPIDYLAEALRKRYMDAGFPLNDRTRRVAQLARELYNELATAYKIIIEQMLASDAQQFDQKLLVISLQRALYYLIEVMVHTNLVYQTWPPELWQEINAIYAYARQNRVHRVAVRTGAGRDKKHSLSIEELYIVAQLFAASTPLRLRPRQALALATALPAWTPLVVIDNEFEEGGNYGVFVVNMRDQAPAVHRTLGNATRGRNDLILDARRLLKKLRSDFEQAPWEVRSDRPAAEAQLTKPLLRQLYLAWGNPPDRRHVRTSLHFQLHALASFNAIYDTLDHPVAAEVPARRDDFLTRRMGHRSGTVNSPFTTTGSELPLRLLDDGYEQAGSSMLLDNPDLFTPSPTSKREVWDENSSQLLLAGPPQANEFHTLNESAEGYCLAWSGSAAPKIRVGELIGIENQGHSKRPSYALAVVRWLRQDKADELTAGVQIISPNCQTGEISPLSGSARARNEQTRRCLILPPKGNTPGCLITADISFPAGSELYLNQDSHRSTIKLERLLEVTSAFARSEYIEASGTKPTASGKSDEGRDFDDLWTTL